MDWCDVGLLRGAADGRLLLAAVLVAVWPARPG